MRKILVGRVQHAGWGARALMGLALTSASLCCADVLGIPSEPRLNEAAGAPLDEGASQAGTAAAIDAPDASHETPSSTVDVAGNDEGLVLDGLVGPSAVPSSAPTTESTGPSPEPPADAAADAGSGAPSTPLAAEPELGCAPGGGRVGRVPVDILLVVDNSGSMAAAIGAVERSLGSFAAFLEDRGVDFRIIVLSRHRVAARTASDAAATSVCVESPLSGLESCPSARPVLSERFFHYSIKIDAEDSFTRILTTYAAPDAFGLAPSGWSEWLRAGSRKAFIEITDADADVTASDFVAGLRALGPEHFGGDASRPSFVFHSLVGVRAKLIGPDVYAPDEPIETRPCASDDTNPDNAGEAYQELSRLTRGLRFSLCPADGIEARLLGVAASLVLTSIRLCPADADEDQVESASSG